MKGKAKQSCSLDFCYFVGSSFPLSTPLTLDKREKKIEQGREELPGKKKKVGVGRGATLSLDYFLLGRGFELVGGKFDLCGQDICFLLVSSLCTTI